MGNKKRRNRRRDRKCDRNSKCKCTNCTYPTLPSKKPVPVIQESPEALSHNPGCAKKLVSEIQESPEALSHNSGCAKKPVSEIQESPKAFSHSPGCAKPIPRPHHPVVTTNSYVYMNENVSQNTISAWLISSAGYITRINTYTTGGTAGSFGYLGPIDIVVIGTNLYVANTVSNDISGFTINSTNGVLTPMAGSPYATGGMSGGNGMSLTASPNGKFLYVANQQSNTISVFSIDSVSGVLTLTSTFANPYGTQLMQIHVSPNNNFLLATIYDIKQLASFSINQLNGQLTAIGSVNIVSTSYGSPAGIDITANSNFVYVGVSQTNPPADSLIVDVFYLNTHGVLSGYSNYIENIGVNGQGQSNFVKLSNDNKYLFVDSTSNSTITTLRIKPNNTLARVSASTIPAYNLTQMVINKAGTLLYNLDNANGFYFSSIASNGATTFVNSASGFGGSYPPTGIAIYN